MPKNSRFRLLAVVATLAVLSAACGNDDAGPVIAGGDGFEASVIEVPTLAPTEIPVPTPAGDVDNTDLSVKPLALVSEDDPPTELVTNDIVVGEGDEVASGDFLIMKYVGVLYSTGIQFDASWDRDQPFPVVIGEGNVIQGWDDGIVGMAPGGRRELIIPPEQAYGEGGSGSGSIGPNETLVFIVDLVALVSGDTDKPEVDVPDEPATELGINDLVEGTGAEIELGSQVWVHYVGFGQASGEQFDASLDRGLEPIAFQIGAGQVIPGWDEGLLGMKEGGRRELIIPSELAYGDAGAGDVIAPGETLVFVVDLVAIAE